MTTQVKVCLVNPPLGGKGLYGDWDLSGVDSVTPPIGILQLAAVLRDQGVGVSVIDAYACQLSPNQTAGRIMETGASILGLGATTPAVGGAAAVAKIVKERQPDTAVVIGGAHVTAVPLETMERYGQFDIGVIGEGEAAIVELVDALANGGKNLSEVSGIIYRRGGSILSTPPRPFIQDLDSLPLPAWDMLPSLTDPYHMSIVGTKSDRATAIVTSRGCPGRCAFCDTTVFGSRFRSFSSDYVLAMLEHLMLQYGIKDFLIYDDNFITNRKRLRLICEGIVERGWRLHWSCCGRVDMVNPEVLALMRRAGCWQIEYGIESGSEEILTRMHKQISREQIRKALQWTRRAGIMTRGNFILGYIGETRKTLEETLHFALSIDLDYYQQTFLTPYPGSVAFEQVSATGEAELDWEKMNNLAVNYVPEALSKKELVAFSQKIFRRFYLRPRVMWTHIKRLRTPREMYRFLTAASAFLKTLFR